MPLKLVFLSMATLSSLQSQGKCLYLLYRDGSCQHPAFRTSKFAAMATIIDLCHDDEERKLQARLFKTRGFIPGALRKLACSGRELAQQQSGITKPAGSIAFTISATP